MPWEALVGSVTQTLSEHDLLRPGMRWVLGVSGGPDSTVLVHLMHEIARRQSLGWTLHAAHMHHGLRGDEADADARFVERLAGQLGISYHFEQIDVRRHVDENGGNTEEIARERRYEFLERVALRVGSEWIAVGHHADDNAETILHRICRGTGLRGLAGMSVVRPVQEGSRVKLVRPLLSQRRAALEAVVAEKNFETCVDSTNLSPKFTRGRIRTQILPTLRSELNPNVSEALLRLAEQARWMNLYVADAGQRVFDSLVVEEGPQHLVLNRTALLSKQRIIQAEVIRRAVSLVLAREQDLSFTHVEAVLRLAEDPASGKELHLPGPVVVRKQYGRLTFCPLEARPAARPLEIIHVRCPGETSLPAPLSMELTAEVCPVHADKIDELRQTQHAYEEWVDFDRVRLPLLVRGRQDGDRFHPLGAPGAKSLSDFLIGEKIDPAMRARTGVLCDQDGPIWVMPLRIDERVKLRPTSQRALRLRLRAARGPH
jgi:tRNA(Ile)-lysidine synthase